MPTLTIIIPAYNEGTVIGGVLKNVHERCGSICQEIIVVDDGSDDNTSEAASLPGITVIRHPRNRGYGAALKTGIRAAKTDYVMTMDSDGQHRVEDVQAIWHSHTDKDMIVGQRTTLLHSQLWRMPGKWLLGWMANYIVRQNIPDLNSGLRLMKRDIVAKYMHLCPDGFSFSTTITLALFTQGYTVDYLPIQVQKRQGTLSTVRLSTGFQTIMLIIRLAALFAPLRIFLPASFLCVLVGILWGIPYALTGHGVSIGAMLAIVTGVLLFALGVICDQISQLRLERYQ